MSTIIKKNNGKVYHGLDSHKSMMAMMAIHIMSIIKLENCTVSIFKLLIHLILKLNIFEKNI